MKLRLLGTGGAFTRIRSNFHNNALLEIGDRRFLVDCSLYALDALEEDYDLTPLDLDGVLVTHCHGDHISGLEEVGFRTHFLGDESPALYCHPDILPSRADESDYELDLWNDGLRVAMQKIRGADGQPVDAKLETYFDVRLEERFELGDGDERVELEWFATDHAPGMASFGLRFDTADASICYTADARPLDEELYREFDLILHDCVLMPRFPGTLHTHLEELLELPGDIQKRIRIMHYGDVGEARRQTADTPIGVAEPGDAFEM